MLNKIVERIKAIDWKPVRKMVKEAGRWAVFAFVAVVCERLGITEWLVEALPFVEGTPSADQVTMILRLSDAIFHDSGVVEKGLVPF